MQIHVANSSDRLFGTPVGKNEPESRPGSGSSPGPLKGAAPQRGAAATDGPGPDPDLGPGPGSEHYYVFFLSLRCGFWS